MKGEWERKVGEEEQKMVQGTRTEASKAPKGSHSSETLVVEAYTNKTWVYTVGPL